MSNSGATAATVLSLLVSVVGTASGSAGTEASELSTSALLFWVKFVVSRCENGFFCFVNHLSGGGVNANHNAKHSPSLACKNKTENEL